MRSRASFDLGGGSFSIDEPASGAGEVVTLKVDRTRAVCRKRTELRCFNCDYYLFPYLKNTAFKEPV